MAFFFPRMHPQTQAVQSIGETQCVGEETEGHAEELWGKPEYHQEHETGL